MVHAGERWNWPHRHVTATPSLLSVGRVAWAIFRFRPNHWWSVAHQNTWSLCPWQHSAVLTTFDSPMHGVDCASWSRQTFRHANHAVKPALPGCPGAREGVAARGGRGSRTENTPFERAMHRTNSSLERQYVCCRCHQRRSRSITPSSELNSRHPSRQGTTVPLILCTTRGAFPNRTSPVAATTSKTQDRRVSDTRLVTIATENLPALSHLLAALLASCSVNIMTSERKHPEGCST